MLGVVLLNVVAPANSTRRNQPKLNNEDFFLRRFVNTPCPPPVPEVFQILVKDKGIRL
jgi:hypothetical protein